MGKVRSNKKKEGNMKKIFLTSGLVLCMACPAFANVAGSLEGNTAGECNIEPLGVSEDGATANIIANWTANSHTITYVHGTAGERTTGFSGDATSINVASAVYDTDVGTAANNPFSIAGYDFVKWTADYNTATGANTDTDYTPGTQLGDTNDNNKYKVDADLVMTAQWTPKHYTVTYAAGTHGSGSYEDTNGATYDANYSVPAAANSAITAATGYTFIGFNTTTGQTTSNFPDASETPWTRTDGLTVYAAYTANTTTITYSCGAGISGSQSTGSFKSGGSLYSVANHQQTATYDANYTHPTVADECEMEGYTVTGWKCVDNTASTVQLDDNGISDGKWHEDVRNVTCTAQWTQNTLNLHYDTAGGTSVNDGTCAYDGSISLPTTTKTGYTFNGWTVQ